MWMTISNTDKRQTQSKLDKERDVMNSYEKAMKISSLYFHGTFPVSQHEKQKNHSSSNNTRMTKLHTITSGLQNSILRKLPQYPHYLLFLLLQSCLQRLQLELSLLTLFFQLVYLTLQLLDLLKDPWGQAFFPLLHNPAHTEQAFPFTKQV